MIKPLVLDSKRKEEGVSPSSSRLRLYPCFLAHPVSFPFRVSPQHPLVSSLVSRGNSVEISWFGPKSAKSAKCRGILPISSVSPQILPQTSSQTQEEEILLVFKNLSLRRRETRDTRVARWSTKHPLVSLEISGNAKCWGPSRFLFGFRQHGYRPNSTLNEYRV